MTDSHPIDVHVGKRLRQKRTLMGLSQAAIANAIGVTFQQVQKYERGINRMSASRMYDFARAMGVPVAYFFDDYSNDTRMPGMAENAAPAFEHENTSTRETMEIMRAYYRIKSPAQRKRVLDLMRSMADSD